MAGLVTLRALRQALSTCTLAPPVEGNSGITSLCRAPTEIEVQNQCGLGIKVAEKHKGSAPPLFHHPKPSCRAALHFVVSSRGFMGETRSAARSEGWSGVGSSAQALEANAMHQEPGAKQQALYMH